MRMSPSQSRPPASQASAAGGSWPRFVLCLWSGLCVPTRPLELIGGCSYCRGIGSWHLFGLIPIRRPHSAITDMAKGGSERAIKPPAFFFETLNTKDSRMDPKLIDCLYLIQGWLRAKGKPYVIHILSGYRTSAHNRKLEREGAAKNSLHMRAMAADIRIPGVSARDIAQLAKAIGVGVLASTLQRVSSTSTLETSALGLLRNLAIALTLNGSLQPPWIGNQIYGVSLTNWLRRTRT